MESSLQKNPLLYGVAHNANNNIEIATTKHKEKTIEKKKV
jgi:hypothetical protein